MGGRAGPGEWGKKWRHALQWWGMGWLGWALWQAGGMATCVAVVEGWDGWNGLYGRLEEGAGEIYCMNSFTAE